VNVSKEKDIANVLIVDNDPEVARIMLEILARKGIRGHLVADSESALDFIGAGSCDLVFTGETIQVRSDRVCRRGNGFDLLGEIGSNWPELPVVMIADAARAGSKAQHQIAARAVKAVRCGCCDFLIRPPQGNKIEKLLDTFLPQHDVSTADCANADARCLYKIVGSSPSVIQTVELANRVAPTSAPVLISGDSGTGKELMAYLVHHRSRRAQGPYVKVNCAALSDSLLDSELFGHEKGAFTGAHARRRGRFEMAHGGTLLLDEITETPIRFQAKLLRVLEQQDFERVGGSESVPADVRVISTTNKDLLQEIQQGRFRRDLYYRLSGVRLVLAPLRERKDDLPDLVWHFVNQYAREVQRRIVKLDPAMMKIFAEYYWPGNVRQLRNVVRTSLILGVGETLSLADVSWLFDELQPLAQQQCGGCDRSGEVRTRGGTGLGGLPLEQVERRAILDTLHQTGGNRTKAAKVLGISDRTLRDRMHRYRREGSLQPA
jgi:two-component system response regulator AtoC